MSRRRQAAAKPQAPPASSDDDVFIPPNFGGAPLAPCNGVTPDDDGEAIDVFIPASFGTHTEQPDLAPAADEPDTARSAQFDRAVLLDRMGFTETGRCKYGCRGTESPHVPLIGWHLRTCGYWEDLATMRTEDLPF